MKILICGENPLQLKMMKNELEQEGDEVRLSWSGIDLMAHVIKFMPDVLITEVLLPQINGFEFIDNVRKHFPKISIMVLSSLRSEHLIDFVFRLGANDFVFKPFDPETLRGRILKLQESKNSLLTLNYMDYVTSV
ncbi:MAG: response regulator [Bacteroidetes bacterium]|jgi:DNA-binding response OmpR family regulator|nr:response regulator [Bacteroidota bacterium]